MPVPSFSEERETGRRPWWAPVPLTLRRKLVLAFGAMAVIAGVSGVIGLGYVESSTATVREFTEVASPMLTESVALIENAERTRSMFLAAIANGDSVHRVARDLGDLRVKAATHIAELQRLSARANIDIQISTIEQSEQAFAVVLAQIVRAAAAEKTAVAAVRDLRARYETSYRDILPVLGGIADRAEANVTRAEEIAKTEIQARTATVDALGDLISDTINTTYPVVRNVNRILRGLEQVDGYVELLPVLLRPEQFSAAEEGFVQSFRFVDSVSRKLRGRLRNSPERANLAAVQQGLAELETTILGPDGLLQNERNRAAAAAALQESRQSLEGIERGYFAALGSVEEVVRGLNQRVRERTEAETRQAFNATAAAILVTLVGGMLFALVFANRLAAPLIHMTEQVTSIRASGVPRALPDPSVVQRSDEVGILSRSFNAMMAELAAARQELIARSEAEISRQFERLNLAINSMPQGLCMFDADRKLIISNRRYAEIYGLRPEQVTPGTDFRAMVEQGEAASVDGDQGKGLAEQRLLALESGQPWYYVYQLRDGRSIAISHLPVSSGGSIATYEDITERRKAEAQIAHMALHDMLTGLPNRVQFRNDMEAALSTMRDAPLAILSLDLDYFKNVNDTLGHPVGDELLKSVGARLSSLLRAEDKVARLGGDEFAIVQMGVEQPIAATGLAERLVREMAEPFIVDDHQIVIGASVGISLAPGDGRDADRLMKNADMALYRAKEEGRGTFRFFEPEMDARMQSRRRLELDLRRAIVVGEFELLYQPLVRLDTDSITGCEALLRWNHPQRGVMLPAEFVPLAEEIGLINQIGAWALATACAEARGWPDDTRVAINLSAIQFKSGHLVRDVVAALEASGLPADRLELEITEAVLLSETTATLDTLNELHRVGVRISMDEFGTGYSSLGYLRKFSFDKIKIDQSFIGDITHKADSMAIVRAVAGLSNTLGIATTAEGVETEAQLSQLRKEGCTEAQGGLFSTPKNAAEIGRLLAERVPAVPAS